MAFTIDYKPYTDEEVVELMGKLENFNASLLLVKRVARALGLVQRPKPDWPMAIELTEQLRQWDPEDPVRYDFALFGLGGEGRL